MRLRLDCNACSYWLWCETPEGSGTISISCPNCGHAIAKTVSLSTPRRDVAGHGPAHSRPTDGVAGVTSSPVRGSSAGFWFGAGAHPTKNRSRVDAAGTSFEEPAGAAEDPPPASASAEILGAYTEEPAEPSVSSCRLCGGPAEEVFAGGTQIAMRCLNHCRRAEPGSEQGEVLHQSLEART